MAIPLHIHVDILQVDSAAYPTAIPLHIQDADPDRIQVVVRIQGMLVGASVGRYVVTMEVER